jgi:hypothetical protein
MLRGDIHNISPRFLPKDIFDKLGGFDENLVAAEDYEIYNKMRAMKLKVGRIDSEEIHLGEPSSIIDIIKKHYFYGKTLSGSRDWSRPASTSAELTFWQKSPIKFAYLKNWYKFILRFDLALGLFVYNFVRYISAGFGFLAGKLSTKSVEDKSF